ncbi:MAG TPA: hypothetical protein VES36_08185 [Candidatus Limnocylindrales bacterium]|nr:hypothetical protein [Candidatus Limnocylindrales bacterium]
MSEPTDTWQPPASEPAPGAAPSWPPAVPGSTRHSLPGMLVAAAVILFVAGGLSVLIGLLVLASGALISQMPNTSGLSDEQFRANLSLGSAFAIAFGIAGVVAATAHIAAGVGILRRAGWARIIGMVLAVLLILVTAFLLIIIVVGLSQPVSSATLAGSGLTEEQYRQFVRLGGAIGVGLFGVSLAAYVFVLVALIRRGDAFD